MPSGPQVISGVVRDRRGNPVAGARVYFVGGPGPFPDIAALTDERGAFRLSAPSAGRYEIEGTAEGFRPGRVPVDAEGEGSAAADIELDPAR